MLFKSLKCQLAEIKSSFLYTGFSPIFFHLKKEWIAHVWVAQTNFVWVRQHKKPLFTYSKNGMLMNLKKYGILYYSS